MMIKRLDLILQFIMMKKLKDNMKEYIVDKYDKIEVIGDIHGEISALIYSVKNNVGIKKTDDDFTNSIIIIAGDCGLGFPSLKKDNKDLLKLNDEMKNINSIVFFIRGNHDDPDYFDGKTVDMSNLKAIPDYSIIRLKGTNVLCVGGAISIDRKWREKEELRSYSKRTLYWPEEGLMYDEEKLKEIKEKGIKVDIIITHTAPKCFYGSFNNENSLDSFYFYDFDLKADKEKEDEIAAKLYDYVIKNFNPKLWIYGHFHKYNEKMVKNTMTFALPYIDNYHFKSLTNNEIHKYLENNE